MRVPTVNLKLGSPFARPAATRRAVAAPRIRATSGGDGGGLGEDVLARLKAAEAEAAKLREQLAAVQGEAEVSVCEKKEAEVAGTRVVAVFFINPLPQLTLPTHPSHHPPRPAASTAPACAASRPWGRPPGTTRPRRG